MIHYFERNRLWLNAFLFGAVICLVPILIADIDPAVATSIPKWIPSIGLVLSGFIVGAGAMFTDTASAKFVRYVGVAFGIAAILYQFFG